MLSVNNITRMLDAKKIKYQSFNLPEQKISALDTAGMLQVPPEIIYKTIVCIRTTPGKPMLAVIPATHEVDLNALAKCVKEKKVKASTQAEAERLTGLTAGGISPLALINKGFLILLSEEAIRLEFLHISGGQLGLNIRLSVKDFLSLTRAQIGNISSPIIQE
jgi:Cys-tRNA(Pro)/Cys-tRNA(Cys) deacylase